MKWSIRTSKIMGFQQFQRHSPSTRAPTMGMGTGMGAGDGRTYRPSSPRSFDRRRKKKETNLILLRLEQIALASYVNPLADPVAWDRMIAYPSNKVSVLVANVLNGPDTTVNEDWAKVIDRAHASGKRILGYVRTGYLGPSRPGLVRPTLPTGSHRSKPTSTCGTSCIPARSAVSSSMRAGTAVGQTICMQICIVLLLILRSESTQEPLP